LLVALDHEFGQCPHECVESVGTVTVVGNPAAQLIFELRVEADVVYSALLI
jgi:hypothetical protein